MAGLGKDIQKGGEKIQGAAKEIENQIVQSFQEYFERGQESIKNANFLNQGVDDKFQFNSKSKKPEMERYTLDYINNFISTYCFKNTISFLRRFEYNSSRNNKFYSK
ncbi:hypothetical protein ACTFIZ_002966 [Dictyostelium cf. discoideum]